MIVDKNNLENKLNDISLQISKVKSLENIILESFQVGNDSCSKVDIENLMLINLVQIDVLRQKFRDVVKFFEKSGL